MNEHVVIVGGGQAALQLATSLRELGHNGSIKIISDELHAPYQRPPLSKAFLSGGVTESALFMQEPSFFEKHGIDCLLGRRVVSIDRKNQSVCLTSGAVIPYEHLVLAMGSRNRRLPCMTNGMDGVVSLRGLDDARALKAAIEKAKRILVVGAGFLGLEAATVAAAAGKSVVVVEAADRVLARATSPMISAAIQKRHEARGVLFVLNDLVTAIHTEHAIATGVELRDGGRITAGLVLISIGVVPNSEIAQLAGLDVADGVIVDMALLTSDPRISAIGDCASFPFVTGRERHVRLESVQNAVDQARFVARRLSGADGAYREVPMFWSDQAGCRLQIAGLGDSKDDCVARGDPEGEAFSIFRFREQKLMAVESLNRMPDHMLARKLLRDDISPTREQITDTAFDLRNLARRTPADL